MKIAHVHAALVPDMALGLEKALPPGHSPELIQAVKAINAAEYYGANNELAFALDPRSHRPVIRLVDRETRQVIRQIPTESALSLAETLRDLTGSDSFR